MTAFIFLSDKDIDMDGSENYGCVSCSICTMLLVSTLNACLLNALQIYHFILVALSSGCLFNVC